MIRSLSRSQAVSFASSRSRGQRWSWYSDTWGTALVTPKFDMNDDLKDLLTIVSPVVWYNL